MRGIERQWRDVLADLYDPDAIVHNIFLFLGVIFEILEFALLSKVVNAATSFANGYEGAQIFDRLHP